MFIPWHRDQLNRLGLASRAVGVRAMDTQVASYVRAFDDEDAYRQVKTDFETQARALVEAGAEVIIPAGGLPMLLLAREKDFTIDGAVVLNGIVTVAIAAEASLKLRRLTGAAVRPWDVREGAARSDRESREPVTKRRPAVRLRYQIVRTAAH